MNGIQEMICFEPALETTFYEIVGAKGPTDATEFDPIPVVNALFPNGKKNLNKRNKPIRNSPSRSKTGSSNV